MSNPNKLTDISKTVMPFGQYVGQTFDEIPLNYFDWIIGQTWLKSPLKEKIEEYLSMPPIVRALRKEMGE
jgi:uncharacterized protein (DUF3820 family)